MKIDNKNVSNETDKPAFLGGAIIPSLIYNDWQDINSAPKNSKWIEGLTKRDEIVKCHYACNLSGEEQPAFEGFFQKAGNSFFQVEILKWRNINEA